MSKLRQLSRSLHLYLGLSVGVLLVVIGLSGTVLSLRGEAERAWHPELYRAKTAGAPAPVDTLLATVAREFPDQKIFRVFFPAVPGETVRIQLRGAGTVYLDPPTAAVQGVSDPNGSFMDVVMDLHRHLLAGEVGNQVVSVGAMVMMVLSLTGIVLWMPRKGWARFRWKWARTAPTPVVSRELHTILGFYAALGLLVSSWTGIAFTHRDAIVGFYAWATGSDMARVEAPEVTARPGASRASLQAIVTTAQARFPEGQLRMLRLGDEGRPVQVAFKQAGEVSPHGNSTVFADPYTGAVLSVIDPASAPIAYKLYYAYNYAIHTGEIGGWPTRILVMTTSSMPAVLFVTGLLLWWPKFKAKRRARTLKATIPAAPASEPVKTI